VVVGETATKVRVRIMVSGGVILPGRRWAEFGDVVLVPKHAVLDPQGDGPGSHPEPTPDPS
ncbi:MAG: hypothetical protein ACK4GM_16780, partial [Tabrizicola sp.]